jgi:hypothetical protein
LTCRDSNTSAREIQKRLSVGIVTTAQHKSKALRKQRHACNGAL